MLTTEETVAGLLFASTLLIIGVALSWANDDPRDAAPVRIDDRKSWRREPSYWEMRWPHVVGPIVIGLEVYLLLARLSGAP
ncbi:MAG TPA: hypothetical protein VMJ31_05755 [Methylocystis sp.]|nr:hypothetical protein [Methylocystis sp.]